MSESSINVPVVTVRLVEQYVAPYDANASINSPESAVKFLRNEMKGAPCMEIWVLALNMAGIPITACKIASGGTAEAGFEVKRVLQVAVLANASSVILAHNQVSGNPNPDDTTFDVAKDLGRACALAGLSMRDYLIITSDSYTSLAEQGFAFGRQKS